MTGSLDRPTYFTRTRLGLWGAFDLESFGHALFPWIATHELNRRIPDVEIRTFAPFGRDRPTYLSRGEPAEPLGPWNSGRIAALSADLDCVLIGGGDLIAKHDTALAGQYGVDESELVARAPSRFFIEALGPDLEESCPVIWNAVGLAAEPTPEETARLRSALADRSYVAVRDEPSRMWLENAGVSQAVVIVPDSGFLLPRCFSENVLAKRLEYLRLMDWYPRQGDTLVVQGDRDLLPFVSALVPAITKVVRDHASLLSVVLVETSSCQGDGEFADAMQAALPLPSHRLPSTVTHEDLVAVIAAATGFVGASLHGSIAAFCYRRPHVVLNLVDRPKLEGFARLIGNPDCLIEKPSLLPKAVAYATAHLTDTSQALARLQDRVDAHFDRVADRAQESAARRIEQDEPDWSADLVRRQLAWFEERFSALRRSHEVRGRRLVDDRVLFADELARHRQEIAVLTGEVALRTEALAESNQAREAAAQRADAEGRARQRAESELAALRQTRTFRYTAWPRAFYRRLRHQSR